VHPDDHHTHLWLYRSVMAIIAVAVPVMGFMTWPDPLAIDPFAARLGIAALAGGGLVATHVSEQARTYARQWVFALGVVVLGWFCYLAGHHQITSADVVGLLPCACIMPMVSVSWRELVFATVYTFAATAVACTMSTAPEFPPATFVILFVIITLGLGLPSLSRAKAERRLHELTAELDARVEFRTVELRKALDRAEHEAEERRIAEQKAVQANQAKSRFLANMSHELRTPLNAVIGYTEMVAEELDDLDGGDDLSADLGHATGAANHLLGLIDDLLDLSRIEAEELPIDMAPVSVDEVVQQALAHTPQLAPTSIRGLQVDVPAVKVRADPYRLTQVLTNLLTNAAKFTPSGLVSIAAAQQGDRVSLSVQDTGEGIPADDLPHVFERFRQVDGSATRRHGGTGLGLAITQMLVQRMDGHIEVTSEPGKGSTFTVWLLAA